jgi:hypothetical protein
MGWKSALGVIVLSLAAFGQEAIKMKSLEKGAFSGIQESRQVVITNQPEWVELWRQHTAQKIPPPPPPEIDFAKESVLFVSAGRKNTGGYAIEITGLKAAGKATEVTVATREPKPGGFNIQALTAPYHIVVVPKLEGDVKFQVVPNKEGG